MSGYIVEEPNDCPIFVNENTFEESVEYWRLYSPIQNKRYKKVLNQMRETWFNVFKQVKFMRDYGNISLDDSNSIMYKVHKLFMIEHNNKIEYYNEEKIRIRKQKGYLSKKITKLRNTKNKI